MFACEQGGWQYGSANVAQSLSILKAYKDTNWTLQTTSCDVYDQYPIICDGRVASTDTFVYTHGNGQGSTYAEWFYWWAAGYVNLS